jgi:hypothetical protein
MARKMTVYTLGPHDKKWGPFAEVHAQSQLDARRKVQTADERRNWLDEEATYCMPIGATATRYIAEGEVRIYEKFEDLPPV